MVERVTQLIDGDPVSIDWPTLESAKNLKPMDDEQHKMWIKALALYDKRRISHMSPPIIRQISEYLTGDPEGISTSVISYMTHELIERGYLNGSEEEDKGSSRDYTIKVIFSTIKLKSGKPVKIIDFPDIPGLTHKKRKSTA